MHSVVLHLGSNQGNKEENIQTAYDLIGTTVGEIISHSSLHITKAWGDVNQPDFVNSAVKVNTDLSPFEVLQACQNIELRMGRKRKEKWGQRIIDIDIIFYDDLVLKSSILTLPHPLYEVRDFVMAPLKEILKIFKK